MDPRTFILQNQFLELKESTIAISLFLSFSSSYKAVAITNISKRKNYQRWFENDWCEQGTFRTDMAGNGSWLELHAGCRVGLTVWCESTLELLGKSGENVIGSSYPQIVIILPYIINPLVTDPLYLIYLYMSKVSIKERNHRKIFVWASCLWVGRR